MNETPGGPAEPSPNHDDPIRADEQPPSAAANADSGLAAPYQQRSQPGQQSVAYGPSGGYGQRQPPSYPPPNPPGQGYDQQGFSNPSSAWPPSDVPSQAGRPNPGPARAARSGSMPGPAVPGRDQQGPGQQGPGQQGPSQQGPGQQGPKQASYQVDRSGEAGYATDDLVTMLQPAAPPRARRGWRAFFRLPPSQREQREFAQLDSVRSQFARPVTLMIANPKGGTGKTPISLLLAGEFGEARGGGVVVIDNNENRGTAAFRSYFPHRRTVADLLDHADELERPEAQFTDLAYFLAHQTTGKYYVLASDESVTRELDEKLFARVHRILSRFFAVIIIDSGNNELASNWLAALDVADGLIVPTQWRQDHVVTANKMLKTLRDRQHPVLARTMIIGTNAPAAEQATPKKAAYEWFSGQHHLQVVEIPTDPHIHEGGVLDRAKMSPKTRRAGLAAASVASFLIVDVADAPPRPRSLRPGETV